MKKSLFIPLLLMATALSAQTFYSVQGSAYKAKVPLANGDSTIITITDAQDSASIEATLFDLPASTKMLAIRYWQEYDRLMRTSAMYEKLYQDFTGDQWDIAYSEIYGASLVGLYRVRVGELRYDIELRPSGMWRRVGNPNAGQYRATSPISFELRNFGGDGIHIEFMASANQTYAAIVNGNWTTIRKK